MTGTISLLLALSAGAGIGFIFYGGLWLTVSRIHSTSHPILLFVASFILRMAAALTGIWFVTAGGDLKRLALCLVGFMIGRWLILRTTRSRSLT